MSFFKKLIERLNRFFDTNLDLEHCVDDFKHADGIAEIMYQSLEYNYNFQTGFEEIYCYKKEECQVEKYNMFELMVSTLSVNFAKNVSKLIKFSRTNALSYVFRNHNVTIGEKESLCNKISLIDKLLKYETIKMFNLRGVKVEYVNGKLIFPKNCNEADKKILDIISIIIKENLWLGDCIQYETYLNIFQFCNEFKVGEINQKYNKKVYNF